MKDVVLVYGTRPEALKRLYGAENVRRCSACREWRSPLAFSPTNGAYLDSRCRECNAKRRALARVPQHAIRQYQFPKGLDQSLYADIPEAKLAYIAGIIDGEGCISSSHPRHNRKPLQIAVAMVHRPTIEWLWRLLGGSFVERRTNQKPARRSWCWTIKGVRTYALLRRILPYMVTKREEAETAIALGRTLWTDNVRGRVTDEVLAERRVLGQRLRDLKRREWPA